MGSLKNIFQRTATYPPLTNLATRLLPPSVTIFMLHRLAVPELDVEGHSVAHIRNCLDYLEQNNYRFISIDDAVRRSQSNELGREKWVAFTLDDGFEEQVRVGADIFKQYDCPTTCFLVTDFVDGKLWPWDYKLMYLAKHAAARTIQVEIDGVKHSIEMGTERTKMFLLRFARQIASESVERVVQLIAHAAGIDIPDTPPPSMQPTTWQAVREAEKKGMQFGPHSARHFILSRTQDATLSDEIERSSRRIREECSRPSSVFCYPSGKAHEFDARSFPLIRTQGLHSAVTTEPGYLEQDDAQRYGNYHFVLPRLGLPDDFEEFKLYTSWAQRVRERFEKTQLQQFYS
ncbi:MAG: polysaccharide deacetylase family protein [Spongiibacteraceae bacterium]